MLSRSFSHSKINSIRHITDLTMNGWSNRTWNRENPIFWCHYHYFYIITIAVHIHASLSTFFLWWRILWISNRMFFFLNKFIVFHVFVLNFFLKWSGWITIWKIFWFFFSFICWNYFVQFGFRFFHVQCNLIQTVNNRCRLCLLIN